MRRVLYLHGFASSPGSRKGHAFERYLGARGYVVERLDLRVPHRDGLRVSGMIEVVKSAMANERVALIGSSLGGLVAAHVASTSPNVVGSVLMAPAFYFAERWKRSLGDARLGRWKNGEPLEVPDHAGGPPLRVDYGFYEDAARVDAEPPGLSLPLLVFHGLRDDVVDIAGTRRWMEASPGALVELDDDHRLEASLPVMLPHAHAFLEPLWRSAP